MLPYSDGEFVQLRIPGPARVRCSPCPQDPGTPAPSPETLRASEMRSRNRPSVFDHEATTSRNVNIFKNASVIFSNLT